MRDLSGIEVRSLIVHVLDAKSTTGLVKSSRPVQIAPNDRIAQYFARHITNSLHDRRAVAADFICSDDEDVSRTCGALIDGSADLVTGSHDLADRLYAIMEHDKRIASGDLAVCTFMAGNAPHASGYLSIMKLDPGFALWHHTELDETGRPYVTFEVADNVLPTVNEKLQKCAFVSPLEPRGQYRLLILDDQIGDRPGEKVARFFLHQFLHARPALDAATQTDALMTAFRVGRREVRAMLTDGQRSDLDLLTRAALRRQQIDLDDLVETLPIPDEAKAKFDGVLRDEIPDRVFDIDARVVISQLPKRKFRGSDGLRVDIPTDLYQTILRSATQKRDENGRPYVEVVLHTDTWEEVT